MKSLAVASLLAFTLPAALAQGAAPTCQARSGPQAPTVVELFTSEGCSSCPPADRWLSTLKGRPDVLALSFHVNYWDRLGWPDRFASSEFTERQYAQSRRDGSAQVYTPQVVVNGSDWRGWPGLPKAGSAAPVSLRLARNGDQVLAEVGPSATPQALGGYWAVLEDGHSSKVRAGENAGETLRHDHVVRLLRPVAEWAGASGNSSKLTVSQGAPDTPRRVVFVVTDARTQRPLQALSLGC